MTKSKKVIFLLILLCICISILFCVLLLLPNADKKSITVDSAHLWPENGDVIAIIDGKEYRYDPVYLYRLTNAVFDEDATKSVEEINTNYVETSSTFGICFGDTMAESAVCLELLYREGLKNYDGAMIKKDRLELYKEAYKVGYDVLANKEASDILSVDRKLSKAHKAAKFEEGQSDEDYLEELEPYIIKFAYIEVGARSYDGANIEELMERYGITAWEKNEDGVPVVTFRKIAAGLGEDLMEKYNVEMVE